MLEVSICIPVFNFQISRLVQTLITDIKEHSISAEIIVIDDASEDNVRAANRELTTNHSIRYIQLESNVGRSAIRNLFANYANSNYLLFLDCDMMPAGGNFIRTYLSEAAKDHMIICGGICYGDPPEPGKRLHWNFGQKREALSADLRNSSPYRYFFSSNFMVPLKILKTTRFDESITGYGYEDSVFAIEVEVKNIRIKHIQLPAEHLRLDDALAFVSKTEMAMRNLHSLYQRRELKSLLRSHIRLVRATERLNKLGLSGVARFAHGAVAKKIKQRLIAGNNSLALLDWYKLFFFVSLQNNTIRRD